MDNTYDNEDEQIETACQLFEQYTKLLNHEFHDYADVEKNGRTCVTIAARLLGIGFTILVQVSQNMETVVLSDDTTQTVLIFTHDLFLIPNVIPIQQPIMATCAVSKVFGPPTISTKHHGTHEPISAKEETWLHSILDNLGAEKTDKNSLNKERD